MQKKRMTMRRVTMSAVRMMIGALTRSQTVSLSMRTRLAHPNGNAQA